MKRALQIARLPLFLTVVLAIVLIAAARPDRSSPCTSTSSCSPRSRSATCCRRCARRCPPRRPSAFDAALTKRTRPVQRIPELERMEREVSLGLATAFDLHYRLRPRLRGVAAELLAARRGIELDSNPDAARRALGDDTWEIVRGDLEPPRERFARRPRHRLAPARRRVAGGALMELAQVQEHATRILDEVERAVVGKREALELVLMGLLADGHVLLEDYPGLAKTLTARSFAQVTSTGFNRIQFTPDLMPADVTGSSIWNQRDADFLFRPGPIFTNLLLADEINRAPPKTQAALLEAMQERQVTIEGVTHPLARPFLVLATQNPIEYEGTYPLPEAQLDRFLLRVSFGYPSKSDEWELLSRRLERREDEVELDPVIDGPTLLELQAAIEHVHVGRVRRRLHRRARLGDAQQQLDRGRREPARQPRRAQARALQGGAGGPRLRHPGRREGRRRARARAPADAEAGALGAAGLRRRHRPRGARERAHARRRRDRTGSGMTPSASPRATAYAALAALFLFAALAIRRPELVVVAAPFALLPALGLALARPPEVRVWLTLERPTALEQDELELELVVASERPVERLELLLVLPGGPRGRLRRAERCSLRLGWEDERTITLRAALHAVGELSDRRPQAAGARPARAAHLGGAGSTGGRACASTRSRRRCARSSRPCPRSRSRATRSRGRRAKGSSSPTCASSPRATVSGRSTGGRAPAATCSSSTSAIRSGTPT